jgi:hypothetical protein
MNGPETTGAMVVTTPVVVVTGEGTVVTNVVVVEEDRAIIDVVVGVVITVDSTGSPLEHAYRTRATASTGTPHVRIEAPPLSSSHEYHHDGSSQIAAQPYPAG